MGFSLEDTHLQAPERLSLLLALLSLALAWALRSGEWLHQAQPLLIKSHGRRAKSLFRYGVDHLRSYRAQLGSQIRAVFGGGTVFVLYLGDLSCFKSNSCNDDHLQLFNDDWV